MKPAAVSDPAVVEQTRGELSFLLWSDLRAFVHGMSAMARATGAPSPFKQVDGPPVPLVVFCSAEGRAFRIGARYDPVALYSLMPIR